MAYLSDEYKMTKDQIDVVLRHVGDNITPEILLMIDYAYHHTDENYDGGLSFLDRLYKKIILYYNIQWVLPNLKDTIRDAANPKKAFVDILNEILEDSMVACYGV